MGGTRDIEQEPIGKDKLPAGGPLRGFDNPEELGRHLDQKLQQTVDATTIHQELQKENPNWNTVQTTIESYQNKLEQLPALTDQVTGLLGGARSPWGIVVASKLELDGSPMRSAVQIYGRPDYGGPENVQKFFTCDGKRW